MRILLINLNSSFFLSNFFLFSKHDTIISKHSNLIIHTYFLFFFLPPELFIQISPKSFFLFFLIKSRRRRSCSYHISLRCKNNTLISIIQWFTRRLAKLLFFILILIKIIPILFIIFFLDLFLHNIFYWIWTNIIFLWRILSILNLNLFCLILNNTFI